MNPWKLIAALGCALLIGCATENTPDSGMGGGTATGGGTSGGGSATGGGGGTGGGSTADAGTIVDVASANPEFSTLVAAVQKAGLVDALNDSSASLTVFAPTNAAFAQLLTDLGVTNGLDGLTAEQLAPILKYHVLGTRVDGAAATSAAMSNGTVTSLGGTVRLSYASSRIRLDGRANVTTADVAANNGVIHVIDAVLLPSIADVATTTPSLSSLTAALTLADTATPSPALVTALDDDSATLTVFAPNNAAFDGLVTALRGSDNGAATGITALTSFRPDQVLPVLRYHVVPSRVLAAQVPATGNVTTLGGSVAVTRAGAAVTVDGADVVQADLIASNGVIHVVDAVLLPSITDVVTTDARFSSLAGAVGAADGAAGTTPKVGEALNGTTNFTLFAPTNTAFTNLGAAPSGQALTNVLLYHAVPGAPVFAAAALGLTQPLVAPTALATKSVTVAAEGTPVGVTVADSTTTKANVVITNLFTANGVIHAVDKVLIPSP